MWSVRTKIALIEKYFEEKNRRYLFVVCVNQYPLSKFGRNQTNSL